MSLRLAGMTLAACSLGEEVAVGSSVGEVFGKGLLPQIVERHSLIRNKVHRTADGFRKAVPGRVVERRALTKLVR
jgi:hypothetical protein